MIKTIDALMTMTPTTSHIKTTSNDKVTEILGKVRQDLSSDDSFRIDGQRLYNLAIHNNYTAHYIVIDVKGKGFQFYTFTFG